MDTFIMKRNGRLGTELRDLKTKLVDFNISGFVSLYLQIGTPAKSGEYKLVFCLGTLQTENNDSLNFNYEDLFGLYISNKDKVSELKESVIRKLAERNPPIIVTRETLRLRERNTLHPGQILHDNNLMKDYSLFDNKAIVVEKLDEPAVDDPSKVLVHVKYLDTEKFELTPPKEVFVPKEQTTLHTLGKVISQSLNIPSEEVECYKVQSLYTFIRSDLLTVNWTTLEGNSNLISSHPWSLLKDGYLLIIKRKEEKIDPEKVKSMKLKTNKKSFKEKASEERFSLGTMMPKETSMKIRVKKKSEITKTQDDTDFGKKAENATEKQKRPHEV